MRHVVNSLILISVLAGPVANAGEDQSFATTGQANGEATSARKSVLKLHPLPVVGGLVLGIFMLPVELELAFHPNISVYALGSPLLLLSGVGGGFALNGGLRGYFSGNAPDGFWLGGHLGMTTLIGGSTSVTVLDLQPQLGYQWVFDNGFSIGVSAGISIGQLMSGQSPITFSLPLGVAW